MTRFQPNDADERVTKRLTPTGDAAPPHTLVTGFTHLVGTLHQATPPTDTIALQFVLWAPSETTLEAYITVPATAETTATTALAEAYPTAHIASTDHTTADNHSNTDLTTDSRTAAQADDQTLIAREWELTAVPPTNDHNYPSPPPVTELSEIETTLHAVADYLTSTAATQLFDVEIRIPGSAAPTTGAACPTSLTISVRSLTIAGTEASPPSLPEGDQLDLGTTPTAPALKCTTKYRNTDALALATALTTPSEDAECSSPIQAPPWVLAWLVRLPSANALLDLGITSVRHPARHLAGTDRDRYRHPEAIQLGYLTDGEHTDHQPFVATPRDHHETGPRVMLRLTDESRQPDRTSSITGLPSPSMRTELAWDFAEAVTHRAGPTILLDLAGTGRDRLEDAPCGLTGTALTAVQALPTTTGDDAPPCTYLPPALTTELETDAVRTDILTRLLDTDRGYVLDFGDCTQTILTRALSAFIRDLISRVETAPPGSPPVTICLDGRRLVKDGHWEVLAFLRGYLTTTATNAPPLFVDLLLPLSTIPTQRERTHLQTFRTLADTVITPTTLSDELTRVWRLPTTPTSYAPYEWTLRTDETTRFVTYTPPNTSTERTLHVDATTGLEHFPAEYAAITILTFESDARSINATRTHIGMPPAATPDGPSDHADPVHNPVATPEEPTTTEGAPAPTSPSTTKTASTTTETPSTAMTDTLYLFRINDTYLFEHYFDGDDIFNTLRQYRNDDKYRFEIPAQDLPDLRTHLESHNYHITTIDDPTDYCVVTPEYDETLLKNSVTHWRRNDHHVYLLKNDTTLETALTDDHVTALTETTITPPPLQES